MNKKIIVVTGAGSMGQAIARRVGAGKHILFADLKKDQVESASKILSEAGFDVSYTIVDVTSRESVLSMIEAAQELGDIFGLIHTAGVSPSHSSPEIILKVDLYGTAVILEEFGNAISEGGSGVVISSQAGHKLEPLTSEQMKLLATTPADELLALPALQPANIKNSYHAYQLAKRGSSLRVMAEAVRWGKRNARINTISPGVIITPLAKKELDGPEGEGYRKMINSSPVGRAGMPDEIGNAAFLLMGQDGGFITGSDFLMDGGATAEFWFGEMDKK